MNHQLLFTMFMAPAPPSWTNIWNSFLEKWVPAAAAAETQKVSIQHNNNPFFEFFKEGGTSRPLRPPAPHDRMLDFFKLINSFDFLHTELSPADEEIVHKAYMLMF